jgi:hypothetical protein
MPETRLTRAERGFNEDDPRGQWKAGVPGCSAEPSQGEKRQFSLMARKI